MSSGPIRNLIPLLLVLTGWLVVLCDCGWAQVAPPVPRAIPLPLKNVRITGGPLKLAQDLNRDYLLALEPDRLLAGYRLRAGLDPQADGYGGWDDVHGRQLTGHAAGHYLSAVSLMYAATGDRQFLERANRIVEGLAEVQQKQGDGYLGALLGTRLLPSAEGEAGKEELVDGKILLSAVSRGEIRSSGFDLNGLWAPWYTLHKTFAGLRDAYRQTGNQQALELEIRFAEWVARVVEPLSESQFQQMLNTEFGGMNEVLADLYTDSGDQRWLELSRRFEHEAILAPLRKREDDLNGKHGNTQIPKLVGSAARYACAGDPRDLASAQFFFGQVAEHHSFATGGHGKDEYFGRPDRLSDRIDGRTAESCNVYNMLKLGRMLFQWDPDPRYAAFQEQALFNHVLGSIDPASGSTCYMVPVGMGVAREYQEMFESFTCCVGSGMENHALHGDGIYFQQGSRLWINQFVPSDAEWTGQQVRISQATSFPLGDSATIELQLEQPRELELMIRRPAWAEEGFSVRINDHDVEVPLPPPGQYLPLRRQWQTGDRISIQFPRSLRLAPLPDNPNRVAILWGPLVLATKIGSTEDGGAERRTIPAIVTTDRDPRNWMEAVPDKPGHFVTRGVGKDQDFHLQPFFSLHRSIYSAHWDLWTPEQWTEVVSARAAEQEIQADLQRRTVSQAQPGEMQPERDAGFKGEETWPVREADRAGRVGRRWFSFDLAVAEEGAQSLVVTCRTAARIRKPVFRILVDGEKIADCAVEETSPAKFVDLHFPLPPELLAGKQKVTVRFETGDSGEIGPVFGLRIVRDRKAAADGAADPDGTTGEEASEHGAAVGTAGTTAAQTGRDAELTIDLADRKAPVSQRLYGIFLEEINHAFDGGLYAELVQNRSFEEGVPPPGMKLLPIEDGKFRMELARLPDSVPEAEWPMPWPWNGNCIWDPGRALIGWSFRIPEGSGHRMELSEANPMNAASSRSLAVHLAGSEGPGQTAELVNSGYWGIHVAEGEPYRLKFHLRPGTFAGTLSVRLESPDGRTLASHQFEPVTPGETWQVHETVLQASGSDATARLVIGFSGSGDCQIDWVSLFPRTFRDRPNGLRRDLAQHLADYRPAFVRYPGGCYVEGLSWESAPDWRTMVCPPEERPGTWGYWKYRSTDGFGYHEFLQFCEDIGSDAMYVAFAGMTVHPRNNVPLDELDPVIQQTLDAIEYAIGPVDSEWGAVRARMGHPEPFPLKYIEIGNEHPPAEYGEYYRRFREAIRARYPQITVIMSMFWSGLNQPAIDAAGNDRIDMVDEHSYRPVGWIRSHSDYFDRYPRTPWKIYVGEYASHHRQGSWLAAMDDSLYLMMLERNGDLVEMASYAPLLYNVHARDWEVNLIGFDSSRSAVHASYHVQKTFRDHLPDWTLGSSLRVADSEPAPPPMEGRIGLGTWNTAVEFRNLQILDGSGVELELPGLYSADRWITEGGDWEFSDGLIRQKDPHVGPARLWLKDFSTSTGRIRFEARPGTGREGFLCLFRGDSSGRFLFANYGANGNEFSAIQLFGEAHEQELRTGLTTPGPLARNEWHQAEVGMDGDQAEMELDGKTVSTVSLRQLPTLFAGTGYDEESRSVIVRTTNYEDHPVTLRIGLEHGRPAPQAGVHVVIRGESRDDDNTLADPDRIVPETRTVEWGAEPQVILPPRSVNVLRIPVTREE